ncbi:MAG: transcription termination/antitermination protein NusA [Candidatus Colwellbacteria bacterium]|nr:transcription termination/antitermination protein NusA [Candidatus Colwellbacteria bacterium]
MKLQDLQGAILQLSAEKGIPKEEVLETVRAAIAAAYKKEYCDKDEKIEAAFDEKGGGFRLFAKKLVVSPEILKNPEEAKETALQEITYLDKSAKLGLEKGKLEEAFLLEGSEEGKEQVLVRFKPQRHILLREAKKLFKDAEVGDWILFPLEYKENYGRISAQTAKQVITQRLRELERSLVFEGIKGKEGNVISGIIQRVEGNVVYVDLGKTTGTLVSQEQIEGERLRPGQRLKVYVIKVEQTIRGPIVFLSRSSPKALIAMFRQEVPEIASGVVEIKSVAREAGSRSKVAVVSNDPEVDPIGSCVGQRGTRIAIIINEFNGEKVDIIPWSSDPAQFIAQALSPAKTLNVRLDDENARKSTAFVAGDQQSLAIGKKGQNVRLAAKLTGWKIDVRLPEEAMEQGTEPNAS